MKFLDYFPVIRRLFRQPARKNGLFSFFQEVTRNLELYYVVDQRQFISAPFEDEHLAVAFEYPVIRSSTSVRDYAHAVRTFNAFFSDVRTFEQKYLSFDEHRTKENAQILHEKKEKLQQQFESSRAFILAAQLELRRIISSGERYAKI